MWRNQNTTVTLTKTFQPLISGVCQNFLQFLRHWVTAYPRRVSDDSSPHLDCVTLIKQGSGWLQTLPPCCHQGGYFKRMLFSCHSKLTYGYQRYVRGYQRYVRGQTDRHGHCNTLLLYRGQSNNTLIPATLTKLLTEIPLKIQKYFEMIYYGRVVVCRGYY